MSEDLRELLREARDYIDAERNPPRKTARELVARIDVVLAEKTPALVQRPCPGAPKP